MLFVGSLFELEWNEMHQRTLNPSTPARIGEDLRRKTKLPVPYTPYLVLKVLDLYPARYLRGGPISYAKTGSAVAWW